MALPILIHTDVLIIGTGPAGAALGCFLAQNGIQGLMVNRRSSTVTTPRAHLTNMATLECFRDIGIEAEAMRTGHPETEIGPWYRFSNTVTSGELFKRFAFGTSPLKQGEYFEASPCRYLDLPQTLSEPLLMKYATQHGFKCRNDVEFVSFEQDDSGVTTTLHDLLTNQTFRVRSRYLAGADGANSKVVAQLGLPLKHAGQPQFAMNVMVECDLCYMMDSRRGHQDGFADSSGLLHNVYAWDKPGKPWAVAAVVRCIKPYKEWLFVLISAPGITEANPSRDEVFNRVKDFLGDVRVPVTLGKSSSWLIQECHAERLSKGNVFCLGDSVHRHSPGKGLGSNTCIQDAYNLAWKLALVLKGTASPSLLDTFNTERQPVAGSVVKSANEAFHAHFKLYAALGLFEPDTEHIVKAIEALKDDSPESAKRRAVIKAAQEEMEQERGALGTEMNVTYDFADAAVYLDDERAGKPKFDTDAGLHYHESTYPGFRLPHAWLGTKIMGQMISTQDLAGKGRFTLFTGIGGTAAWSSACSEAEKQIPGLQVACFGIGWGLEHTDILEMWSRKRGVQENGAVLVRPDRYVAWRCDSLDAAGADVAQKLVDVLRHVLGFSERVNGHAALAANGHVSNADDGLPACRISRR